MDGEVCTYEIRELLIKARTRKAAEKLLTVCKKGSFLYLTIVNCLRRIEKLEKEELLYLTNGQYMKGVIYDDHCTSWTKFHMFCIM